MLDFIRRALEATVAFAIVGVLFFLAGVHYELDQQKLRVSKDEQAAHQTYRADVAVGNTAAADLIKERQQHAQTYRALAAKFQAIQRQIPLIAARSTGATVTASAVASCPDGSTVTQILLVPVPAGGDGGGDDHISLGAVWMWNSALSGQDVPAGACRVDGATGQPDPACAASSGLTLDDAWANQAANAEACARDRMGHQRLIDFIKRREQP